MKPDLAWLVRIAPLLVVCSCATPEAVVVEETPAANAPKEEKPAEPSTPEESALAGPPDDGIRLPDMLGLPSESEFHGTRPSAANPASGSGAVIARPPSE